MSDLEKSVAKYFGLSEGFRHSYPKFAMAAEIETEGRHLPNFSEIDQPYWKTIPEGSLRNGGLEHVFIRPLTATDLEAAFRVWDEHTVFSEFNNSIRTSVHLHYNVRDLTLLQVYNIIAVYWILENILVQLNGNTRVGNLFCLRVKDAEFTCQGLLIETERKNYFHESSHDGLRYAALNLAALRKFGSVEFRFLRGYHESNVIKQWMLELQKMVTVASSFDHPRDVLKYIRETNWLAILRKFFNEPFTQHICNSLGPRSIEDMIRENEVYVEKLVNALAVKPSKRQKIKFIDEDMPGRETPPVVEPSVMAASIIDTWEPTPPSDPDPFDDEEEIFEEEVNLEPF
jgi:hypothetical protein